jgi:hypothetical protein
VDSSKPRRLLTAATFVVPVYFGVNTGTNSDTSSTTVSVQANTSNLVSKFISMQL